MKTQCEQWSNVYYEQNGKQTSEDIHKQKHLSNWWLLLTSKKGWQMVCYQNTRNVTKFHYVWNISAYKHWKVCACIIYISKRCWDAFIIHLITPKQSDGDMKAAAVTGVWQVACEVSTSLSGRIWVNTWLRDATNFTGENQISGNVISKEEDILPDNHSVSYERSPPPFSSGWRF